MSLLPQFLSILFSPKNAFYEHIANNIKIRCTECCCKNSYIFLNRPFWICFDFKLNKVKKFFKRQGKKSKSNTKYKKRLECLLSSIKLNSSTTFFDCNFCVLYRLCHKGKDSFSPFQQGVHPLPELERFPFSLNYLKGLLFLLSPLQVCKTTYLSTYTFWRFH